MRIKTKDMILVSFFSALMAAGAFIRIPFPILPVTLQPFFCALAGVLLGSRLGLISQLVYIFIGLAGLPVFAQGAGITYVLKPSFGFLVGFAACAYIIGKIIEIMKTINLKTLMISLFSGLLAIYGIGMAYMYIILGIYMKKPGITIPDILLLNMPYFVKDFVLFTIIAICILPVIPVIKKAGLAGIRFSRGN